MRVRIGVARGTGTVSRCGKPDPVVGIAAMAADTTDPDARTRLLLDQLISRSDTLTAAVQLAEDRLSSERSTRQRARELRRLTDLLRDELTAVRRNIDLLGPARPAPLSRSASRPSSGR